MLTPADIAALPFIDPRVIAKRRASGVPIHRSGDALFAEQAAKRSSEEAQG